MNLPEQAPAPDSLPLHSTQPRRPRARVAARVWRWAWSVGMGVLLLCMAAWWYLLTQIVPKIEQWRGPMTEEITRHLGGSQIFIAQMKGFSQGWRPAVTMTDVRLLDPDGREGLRLPKLTAQLSLQTLWPTNLWQQRVVFHDIVLDRPQVVVRRDRQGRWHVAGMRMAPAASTASDLPGLSWLLSQHHVQVVQGSVAWFDEWLSPGQSIDASRTLQQVDIQLSTRGSWFHRLHEWRLQATPPASIGRRLSLVSDMRQPWWRSPLAGQAGAPWGLTRVGDWQTWSGQTQVQLPWVDVQALRAWWPLPADIQGGQGALGLTLNVQEGTSQELALALRVQQVAVRLGDGLQPLAFKELRGVIKVAHEPALTRLAWEGLSFITDEDLIWPASQASLELIHSPSMAATPPAISPHLSPGWAALQQAWNSPGLQGRLSTNRVDLALLNRLADRLPLGAALRARMASLSPQGIGENLTYQWHGPAQLPTQYQLMGKIKGLSWMAAPGQPGLAGATLSFQADREGGQASVEMNQGWVEFPGAFAEPRIPVDFLKAQVGWKRLPAKVAGQAPGLQVSVSQADFANADAQGSVQATWRTSEGDASQQFPGSLDLTGRLSHAQGTRVWRYLPAVILQEARDYVQQAVRSGVANDVAFQVKGPLARFPFKDNQGGVFRITANASDVELNYAPGWPSFSQLKGRLIFEGQGMRIEQASARIGAVGTGAFEVVQVQGQIPDLDSDDPVLTMRGEGRGPLDDVLSFIRLSPVGDWTGRMLNEARGQGQSKAALTLMLPLNRIEAGTVQGQVTLDAADQANVRLGPSVPLLQSAQGQVQFTQDTLTVNANARVWGQTVSVQGSRDAQGVPRFVATGVFSGDALKQATEWPVLTRLSRYVKGQTPVTVSVALARHKASAAGTAVTYPELQISSGLAGLAVNLPAPLNKPAAAAWPIKIVHRMDSPDANTDAWLMDMQGGALQFKADYRRDLQGKRPRVVRGLVQLTQGPAPAWPALPAAGVVARVAVPVLDTQAWEPVVAMLQGNGVNAANAGNTAPAVPADDADEFMPSQVHFKAQTLTWQLRSLRDVSMQITHPAPDVWRARIASTQVAGDVEIRPDTSTKAAVPGQAMPRRVVAHLSRLAVPDADARLLNDQAAQQVFHEAATSVPALDITVDQFEWRGLSLGKLEVQAVNRVVNNPGQPAMPEWRLTKLSLNNPDAQLQATGNWALVGAQQAAAPAADEPSRQRAAFSFNLELANSGNLLTRLGLPQTLKGGKGKIAGQLSWLGSPLEPNTASMNGSMVVNLEEGQFLKADPGVAKLLGVLSLQSLPRRLILDFRDVFQQGFAFDKVDGDVTISAGVANTRNLRMRGVQAVVLMEGQADLARETQNLKVFVVPELNAGTASLAYAAINPAIGLGTFIAQVLLRKTVVEANTREFAITGTWTDPKVDRVERSSVPAAEGGASGPAPAAPPPAEVKASQTPS